MKWGHEIPKAGDLVKNRKEEIGLNTNTQICHFDGWEAEMCLVIWSGSDNVVKVVDPLGLIIVSKS